MNRLVTWVISGPHTLDVRKDRFPGSVHQLSVTCSLQSTKGLVSDFSLPDISCSSCLWQLELGTCMSGNEKPLTADHTGTLVIE